MGILDPERAMAALEEGTIDSVSSFFPIEGKKHRLVAKKVYPGKDLSIDDITSQKQARLRGKTWATGIYGDFDLVDVDTGKVVDSVKKMKVLNLPKLTRRFSYIVEGTEYQADHQWRLKSGVYTRRKANGELESQFNLAKGRGFRLQFSPEKKTFQLNYGTSNVPLLPVLRALGVPDSEIQTAWGPELYAANTRSAKKGVVQKLAKILDKRVPVTTDEEAAEVIQRSFSETELRKDTTKITLGASYDKVGAPSLIATSKKLLGVSRGTADLDNRDSLRFKELWSIEEHIPERLTNSGRRINFKLRNNLDRKDSVRSIISSDIFNIPVKSFFTSTSLSQQGSQVNPIDMFGGFLRTTILGPGGISSEQAVSDEAKMVDSSFLGFVDPVHTPEGSKTGVTGHLTLGTSKRGKEAVIRLFDVANKKYVQKAPHELAGKSLAFPDQYDFSDPTAPKPRKEEVVVISEDGGDPTRVTPDEVDYVLQSSKQLFSITANMIPFLPSDQANRAGMATRQMEQAIGLKHREKPWVQASSGHSDAKLNTWDKIVGKLNSHAAPASGTVVSVTAQRILLQDSKGASHSVALYDNFPLNDKKAFITSTSSVKKGDTVKKGQVLADTNFTKDGVYAPGTNLRIGYLPYKGLVFEDGVVISESASEKLTSEHLHKNRAYVEKNMIVGLKKFRANYPGVVSDQNAAKMDEDGIIKKGQRVEPGDVLMTVMQKTEPSKEQLLLKGIHKSLARPYKDKSVTWDKPYTGVVTDVVRNGREMVAYVRTDEPADIGDKVSGRHGNKGVITAVIPDEEMPRNSENEPIHIILNPSGVPGRINVGQVLETSLGKIAAKTGEVYVVDNFQTDNAKKVAQVKEHYRTIQTKDGPKRIKVKAHERELGYGELVKAELAKHKISDTEELFDPDTGKSLGQVFVGNQYIIKHMHQIDKKMTARAHGYGAEYDSNLIPKSGGKAAAQRFGELGLYAMLAHGATANIRDALTYKGDKAQDEVWTAIQTGQPIPAPKPSFAYEKFLAYLNGLGVNVEKEGNSLEVSPLTDKQILSLSNGAIKNGSKVIRGKDLKPEKNGLFDEDITGGPGGKEWSHIALASRMPNPLFEKSMTSLLGLTGKEYRAVIEGRAGLDKDGNYSESPSAARGPSALATALAGVDTAAELDAAEAGVKTARRSELDKANKKLKYLRMLRDNKLSPTDAYTISNIPVLPPVFRPITAMEGGDLNIDGLNMLYRDIAILNNKLGEAEGVLPEGSLAPLRKDLYDAVSALMGTNPGSDQNSFTMDGQTRPPGILTILSGRTSPKQSFFHERLLDRRQDLALRSVIVPDMSLHLDEVGIPRKAAMKIFRPFVVRELVRMGYAPLAAREEIEKGSSLANKALDIAVDKRPVLFKRDPVLHKFGIMGFKAKLHKENTIKIHPLVTGGFNADFDGDTMAIFVPVSQEAVDEAYKMMPSKNLFNPATGRVMYQPTLEGQLGLFLLTKMGKDSGKSFPSAMEAVKAAKDGEISMTDTVTVGKMKTTPGRLMFNGLLPKNVQSDALLTDPTLVMGKDNLQKVLKDLATKSPASFASTMDKIKDLGFGHAYSTGFSFSMGDFTPLREMRDSVMKSARIKEAQIHKKRKMNMLSKDAADAAIVAVYTKATEEMNKQSHALLAKKGNKIYTMNRAGVKPSWAQVRQLLVAPMLLDNAKGRTIPVPVDRSYSEGLDTSGYWVSSSGARKGLVEKVLAVQIPGVLNKQLANTAISYVVNSSDCGTSKGVASSIVDNNALDRFTAKSIKAGDTVIPRNTLVTPNILAKFRMAKVSKVLVRSSLKCEAAKGLCSKCYGASDGGSAIQVGTNIGLIAGAALGERGTQLSMKTFHTGGVAGASNSIGKGIDTVNQLLKMPAIFPGSATLADVSGTISEITKNPAGGSDVIIGGKAMYVPSNRTVRVKKGDAVKKGQTLTDGLINPKQLLELTNIDTVQRYLTDEIHNIYKKEGVKKRNIEVVVKAVTNLGRVVDSGDSDSLVAGDFASLSWAAAQNKKFPEARPIKVEPMLRGLETLPLDQTTDWVARLQYRRLKETFTRAANEGWKSDLHGLHPAPGILYSSEFGKSKGKGPY